MKNSWYSVIVLLLAMGCARKEHPASSAKTGVPVAPGTHVLTLYKPVPVADVTLTLQQVDDSRCPTDVACIRAGSVVTHVQLQDRQGNSTTKILYLGDALTAPDNRGTRSADTVHASLQGKLYRLILTEVLPFPTTSDTTSTPKSAKISVLAL
jgi:hypothetical protein